MKSRFLLLSLTTSLLVSPAVAQDQSVPNSKIPQSGIVVKATTIPLTKKSSRQLAASFAQHLKWPFPEGVREEEGISFGITTYAWGSKRIEIDLLSGDTHAFDIDVPRDMTVEQVDKEKARWKSNRELVAVVDDLFANLYGQPTKREIALDDVSLIANLHPYENGKFAHLISSANVANSYKNQTQCLSVSNLRVGIDRATARLSVVEYKRRPCLEEVNLLNVEQAKQVADWMLTQGKTNVTLKLAYQLDLKQQEALKPAVNSTRFNIPRIEVVEDKWFAPRFISELGYSFGPVYVDLREQRLLQGSVSKAFNPFEKTHSSSSLFDLPKTEVVTKPSFLPLAQLPISIQKSQFAKVWFNGEMFSDLNSESALSDLFYPPVVNKDGCLVSANYFPSFLIDVKREGDRVTLQGQLRNKGKSVIVKLNTKAVTLDGKPIILSSAPQEIDGRLYLPYELLSLCNGVLTRWEPKKNTLYVDTRFLRRDN